MTDSDPQRK